MIANQINGAKKRVVSISPNSKSSTSPDRKLKIDIKKDQQRVSQKYVPLNERAKSDAANPYSPRYQNEEFEIQRRQKLARQYNRVQLDSGSESKSFHSSPIKKGYGEIESQETKEHSYL